MIVRGQAGDFAAFLIEVVDGAEGAFDDLWNAGESLGDAALGDFEQRGFGGVQDFEGIFALIGAAGLRGGADAHQLAQDGLVFDDADVIFNAEAARKIFCERKDVGAIADRFQFLAAVELLAQSDDVDGAVGVDQLAHAGIDAAVGIERKVVRNQRSAASL